MSELTIWKNREMSKMRKDIERLFNRFWSDFGTGAFPEGGFGGPFIDVSETNESVIVKAELPGIDPKDVEIYVTGNNLILRGEKREEKVEESAMYHRVERKFGSFSRSLSLPCKVESDDIKSTYKNGVLKVVMPKCKEQKGSSVKINVR